MVCPWWVNLSNCVTSESCICIGLGYVSKMWDVGALPLIRHHAQFSLAVMAGVWRSRVWKMFGHWEPCPCRDRGVYIIAGLWRGPCKYPAVCCFAALRRDCDGDVYQVVWVQDSPVGIRAPARVCCKPHCSPCVRVSLCEQQAIDRL